MSQLVKISQKCHNWWKYPQNVTIGKKYPLSSCCSCGYFAIRPLHLQQMDFDCNRSYFELVSILGDQRTYLHLGWRFSGIWGSFSCRWWPNIVFLAVYNQICIFPLVASQGALSILYLARKSIPSQLSVFVVLSFCMDVSTTRRKRITIGKWLIYNGY